MQLTRRVSVEFRRACVYVLELYGFDADSVGRYRAVVESRWNQRRCEEDFARQQIGKCEDFCRNRHGGNKYSLYSWIPADSTRQR